MEVAMEWTDRPAIQQKILAFLYDIHAERKPALSFRQIAARLGNISTNTVDYHVKKLERDGLVTRDNKTARSLRLTDKALARFNLPEWVNLPLLGKIKAGLPSPVPESGNSPYDAERPMVAILRSELPNGNFRDLFVLDVQGDSMIDAGVLDGDRIVVKHLESPQSEIRNGDMVVAWLIEQEETTLKRYYCIVGKVELRPENPRYDIIHVEPENLAIRGKLIHVARQVR